MKLSFLILPAVATLALAALDSPAFAINARQFMTACDVSPGCDYKVDNNGYVHGTKGKDRFNCPPSNKGDGQCIMYRQSMTGDQLPLGGLNSTGGHGNGGSTDGGQSGGTKPLTPPHITGLGTSTGGHGTAVIQ
jgi:hypothetical protein